MNSLTCFKAYDIRGKLGAELNEEIAYRIGRAFAEVINADTVVVGGDCRLSSEGLKTALANGLRDSGVDVLDLGMTGTEEIYFATAYLKLNGGIEVTASHNPIDYNGMKLVTSDSRPIARDNGLTQIQQLAEYQTFKPKPLIRGSYKKVCVMAEYVQHMLSYINGENLSTQLECKPIRLVVNAGNGSAGHALDAIEAELLNQNVPIEFIKIHHQADGTFPNGIPNPLLIENRQTTSDAIIEHKADMGIAWDGDFDRCFLFDENGQFIEGYYIVGLLAEAFLLKEKGAKIVHDPRLIWNTQALCDENAGSAIQSKAGHAYIKQLMRQHDAIYGGEMSAHHYFRDFNYCDSGMIPWLLVIELLANQGLTLSQAVAQRISTYPSSGEINASIDDPKAAIAKVRSHYEAHTLHTKLDAKEFEIVDIDDTDGLSMTFLESKPEPESGSESEPIPETGLNTPTSNAAHLWRFNLRCSQTEPLVRLNVETKGNRGLMQQKTAEIMALILE
ncbi:phosphomannomutase [Shewanella sp. UCD-KL12]|uniref:phosphomannomutase n=1 Tax=Shewanella sp. UCD-KL12 TaxID=1917163 RepID=UPI0009705500|nr:phosphomannomutase [Shewanella sp. UCD-KL12]